ncbi:hypothetical protein WDW37_16695 [Bdellovibrionota bacterium FG-1]
MKVTDLRTSEINHRINDVFFKGTKNSRGNQYLADEGDSGGPFLRFVSTGEVELLGVYTGILNGTHHFFQGISDPGMRQDVLWMAENLKKRGGLIINLDSPW